jgi:hypothetical protein
MKNINNNVVDNVVQVCDYLHTNVVLEQETVVFIFNLKTNEQLLQQPLHESMVLLLETQTQTNSKSTSGSRPWIRQFVTLWRAALANERLQMQSDVTSNRCRVWRQRCSQFRWCGCNTTFACYRQSRGSGVSYSLGKLTRDGGLASVVAWSWGWDWVNPVSSFRFCLLIKRRLLYRCCRCACHHRNDRSMRCAGLRERSRLQYRRCRCRRRYRRKRSVRRAAL